VGNVSGSQRILVLLSSELVYCHTVHQFSTDLCCGALHFTHSVIDISESTLGSLYIVLWLYNTGSMTCDIVNAVTTDICLNTLHHAAVWCIYYQLTHGSGNFYKSYLFCDLGTKQ